MEVPPIDSELSSSLALSSLLSPRKVRRQHKKSNLIYLMCLLSRCFRSLCMLLAFFLSTILFSFLFCYFRFGLVVVATFKMFYLAICMFYGIPCYQPRTAYPL